jgi:hypothetical protein
VEEGDAGQGRAGQGEVHGANEWVEKAGADAAGDVECASGVMVACHEHATTHLARISLIGKTKGPGTPRTLASWLKLI